MTRSNHRDNLFPLNPEIERAFRFWRKQQALATNQMADNNNNPGQQMQRAIHGQRADTYGEYNAPRPSELLSCIRQPPINRNDFELKPAFITMLQNKCFHGRAHEDPNTHLIGFKKLCRSFKVNGVPEETIMLWSFPFSLANRAEAWLYTLPPDSITTWAEMEVTFMEKYFPPHKTTAFKSKINNFVQEDGESLYEAWERYKGYQRECPHHGMDKRHLISTFIDGLRRDIKQWISAASGGTIRNQTFESIEKLIEDMARDQGMDGGDLERRRTKNSEERGGEKGGNRRRRGRRRRRAQGLRDLRVFIIFNLHPSCFSL